MSAKAKVFVITSILVAFVSGYMVSSLVSAPAVSLLTNKNWDDAILAGQVVASVGWDTGMEAFYPGMSAQYRSPNISAEKDANPVMPGQQHGLIMAWGSALDDGQEIIGAFEYDFIVAEDLTNTLIGVIGMSPCTSISTFGVGLRDATGKVMCWMWTVPGNQPCNTEIALSINPGGGGPSIAPTSSHTDPGFDLSQVTAMTFHEKGTWSATGEPDPAGFFQNVWNGWRELVLSATVPVEESTWGSVKDRYKE